MSARLSLPKNPTIVVKIGTSSLVGADGRLDRDRISGICSQIAGSRGRGARIVLVSSGAIAAGLPELGLDRRPDDVDELQAIAAVGQVKLMDAYGDAFCAHGLHVGQVLLTRHDFRHRTQYLNARTTLRRLLDLDVVPIVNENDTVADDEIRFGENDRLSALVAHLIAADLLVLLTDQPGLFSGDPRFERDATLIEEVHALDEELEQVVESGAGPLGSGGMASKLAAAKMASWSGVTTLIADAGLSEIFDRILGGDVEGTVVRPHDRRLPSRKLWIAFAQGVSGRIAVDPGAARALIREGGSLLAVGVTGSEGVFRAGDAVEIVDATGSLVAKGLSRIDYKELAEIAGKRDTPLVVHRDDLVVLA